MGQQLILISIHGVNLRLLELRMGQTNAKTRGGLRHTLNIFCPSPLGRGEGEAGGISSTTGAR